MMQDSDKPGRKIGRILWHSNVIVRIVYIPRPLIGESINARAANSSTLSCEYDNQESSAHNKTLGEMSYCRSTNNGQIVL